MRKPDCLRDRIERNSIPEPNTGCWLWLGYVNDGYGSMEVRRDGRYYDRPAHRIAYEAFIGPIPDGLVIDHLCACRTCVNPAHLEAVTREVNSRRGTHGRPKLVRTHCSRGHEFPLAQPGRHRRCRLCHRDRKKEYLNRLR
jgi:hypothetical protein